MNYELNKKAPSPGRLAKRRSIQCFAVPLLLPGIARPLCAVSQNAHAQPAPRGWGQPAFAQNGEQPDRITVSIPAQPTLSQLTQMEPNTDGSACCSKASAHSPRRCFPPKGILGPSIRSSAQIFPTTALCGAARDARSFSSHLQILYQIAMPQKEQAGGRAFRRPQGFLLLYPKRAGFVKTRFSKACQRRALRTL